MKLKRTTKIITTVGVLAAISAMLCAMIHFPIFPAAPFLEYDPADIPIFIGSFALGPGWGLALTVIASAIQGFTVSSGSGIIGVIMHIASTGSFAIVAGLIYKSRRTKKGACIALVCGVAVMVVVMAAMNLLLTPLYSGRTVSEVAAMLLPVIIPFNLIKAGFNALITYFLYKPLSKFIKKLGE